MITLITGVPGSGKTSYLVDLLDRSPEFKNRTLYVSGIPELVIPHEPAGDMKDWPTWATDGAVIVADECQDTFRPRGSGATVPECVAKFETHRHRGLDFFLITQHPNLIDQNIRRLVGKHIHVRRHALGGEILEWLEVQDPNSKTARSAAIRSSYKPPKNAFGKYKSATVHTKIKHKLPPAIYILGALVIAFPLVGYKVFTVIDSKLHPEKYAPPESVQQALQAVKSSTASLPLAPASPGAPASPAPAVMPSYEYMSKPAIPGRPETAPMFQHLLQVKSYPWPAACIKSATRCICYTEQATRIPEIDEERCTQITQNPAFNPYADSPRAQAGAASVGAALAPGQALPTQPAPRPATM